MLVSAPYNYSHPIGSYTIANHAGKPNGMPCLPHQWGSTKSTPTWVYSPIDVCRWTDRNRRFASIYQSYQLVLTESVGRSQPDINYKSIDRLIHQSVVMGIILSGYIWDRASRVVT